MVSTLDAFDDEVEDNVYVGFIKSQADVINKSGCQEEDQQRGTSLVKIDIRCYGNPPYQPGDHVYLTPGEEHFQTMKLLKSKYNKRGEKSWRCLLGTEINWVAISCN